MFESKYLKFKIWKIKRCYRCFHLTLLTYKQESSKPKNKKKFPLCSHNYIVKLYFIRNSPCNLLQDLILTTKCHLILSRVECSKWCTYVLTTAVRAYSLIIKLRHRNKWHFCDLSQWAEQLTTNNRSTACVRKYSREGTICELNENVRDNHLVGT